MHKASLVENIIKLDFFASGQDYYNILNVFSNLPGARNYDRQIYIPLNLYNIDLLKSHDFNLCPQLKSWVNKKEKKYKFNIPEKLKLWDFQKEGVQKLLQNNGNALLADEMRLGKEQPISEPLLTPQGWSTMGKIKIGEYVTGSDGKPKKVLGVYPQGIKDIYEITFSDNSTVRCGLEHLWTVRDNNIKTRKKDWITISLREIIKRGIKYKNGNSKFEIPKIKNPIQFSHKKVYDPYLIGCIIANGYCKGTSITLVINDNDIDIMEKLPYKWEQKRGCKSTIIKNHKKIIKELGLNVLSKYKFIPKNYLLASVKNRKLLLKGLMDCDGSSQRNRNTYHTMSKQLAYDVCELVKSLGGESKVRKYDRTKEGKSVEYQVLIRTNFCPFSSKRKSKNWKNDWRIWGQKITKIEKIGKEESVCIMIDSLDHLYITNNYKLTHNTIQTLIYLRQVPELRPAVIICPSTIKTNWKREINKWMPDESVKIVNGTSDDIDYEDFIIINYDIIKYYLDQVDDIIPEALIIDECHVLGNPKTQRTKAIKLLAQSISHVIGITGTPIRSRPKQLFPILNMIDPITFNNRNSFLVKYCNKLQDSQCKGSCNEEELYNVLKGSVMIRRTREEVFPDMPKKLRQIIPLEIDNRDEYSAARNDLITFIRKTEGDHKAKIAMYAQALVRFQKMKRLAMNGKYKQAIKWIENYLETEEKLVIFCIHREIVNKLMGYFGEIAVRLYGGDSPKNKQLSIDRFQNDKNTRLFIANLTSAGPGLALHAANTTLTLELCFVPADHEQAEDRVVNMGKQHITPINYYLVGIDTIEEEIASIIDDKNKIISSIIDGKNVRKEELLSYLINKYKNE